MKICRRRFRQRIKQKRITGNRKRLPEDGCFSGDWQESIFCIQDLVCAKVLSMVKKEVRWDL